MENELLKLCIQYALICTFKLADEKVDDSTESCELDVIV